MKKHFNKLIKALLFAAAMMSLAVSCDNNTGDTNEPELPKEENVFTVTGTDGISITYKKSEKLKVQQYYIYNSEYICIYNKYSNFSETFNYPHVDKGTTYSYRIFYKFNDEQKILDGKIAVEKGAGEFKTSDYASVTLEKGVLKISGIKIPEFSGATLNNVNISLNSGEGGW
nr:hypothetical protein [Treponema sp.]